MNRRAPARKRRNPTTTVEDKMGGIRNRNLTQVSDFPSVYAKIRCGASRLLEV